MEGLADWLCTASGLQVRVALAADPACPVAVLERLAEDPEPPVAAALVANPACPSSLAQTLAPALDNFALANALRANVTLPSAVVVMACARSDAATRAAAAAHPHLPPDMSLVLAQPPVHPAVGHALAGNPAATTHALHLLTSDVHTRWAFLDELAANQATHSADLAAIAALDDLSVETLTRLAGNPSAGPDTLARLAVCPHSAVRAATARNSACPPEARVLAVLSSHDEPR